MTNIPALYLSVDVAITQHAKSLHAMIKQTNKTTTIIIKIIIII